jgi:hypothetical protein
LDGESVTTGVKTVSWTIPKSSFSINEAQYRNGAFVISQAPLQVEAFGELLCEIPVDVSFQGYDVDVEVGDDDCRIFRLTRSARSICRMRRASSTPFTDADAAALV